MVVAPRVSGSTAGTLGGGGGGGWPRMRSMIHAPRSTGEVVVPLAVTLSTLACVIRPPRGLSAGSATRRSATPSTRRQAVVRGEPLVEHGEVRRRRGCAPAGRRAAVRRRSSCVSSSADSDEQVVEVVVGVERGVGRGGVTILRRSSQ